MRRTGHYSKQSMFAPLKRTFGRPIRSVVTLGAAGMMSQGPSAPPQLRHNHDKHSAPSRMRVFEFSSADCALLCIGGFKFFGSSTASLAQRTFSFSIRALVIPSYKIFRGPCWPPLYLLPFCLSCRLVYRIIPTTQNEEFED